VLYKVAMRSSVVVLVSLLAACSSRAEHQGPTRSATAAATSASTPDHAVTGIVEAPDGSPAAGAWVALNALGGEHIAVARTDAQGRFRFTPPKEPFAITSTSERGTAVFVAHADRVGHSPHHLRLGELDGGTTIAGTLTLTGGALPAGLLVAASRSSKDQGDIFYGEVSATGAFELRLPPGTYTLRAHSEALIWRDLRLSGNPGSRSDVTMEVSRRAPASDEVVAWLRESAIPIATSATGGPNDDLAPLVATLGNARVIGVGEATHGTREFFQIKHRLLERLVATHGVTVFAIEATFSAAELVDDYVQTGRGTAEGVLAKLVGVWRTEEVRDLVVWMRQWNADPRHRRKVQFRGYDMQGARLSIAALRTYFKRVDPASEDVLSGLAPLDVNTNERGMVDLSDAQATATADAVARVVDHLAAKRKLYVSRSSAAEHALATQHARVVEQARARFVAKGFADQFAARDRAMADNVLWLLGQAEPDARVMVWAHNGHIQLDSTSLPAANMGRNLRERLGNDYVSVGFLLNEGSYRAAPDPKIPANTVDVPLIPAAPGDAAEPFARVGTPIFAVDLRAAPLGPVRAWLAAPHLVPSCGWIVSDDERKGFPQSLARLFDVAIYVGHTTSSRPLPRAP